MLLLFYGGRIMDVRAARTEDLPQIMAVYAVARDFMCKNGNPTQWWGGYPPLSMLEEDIRLQQLYVVCEADRICGAFVLAYGEDPTYQVIEEGAWLDGSPYGTIHRIASDGTVPGVFGVSLAFCREKIAHLRIDTHADNGVMQHLALKHGFTYCGIIHVADGSPRFAYEMVR